MRIALIAAFTENRVLGKDNRLIWHLPKDLKHFKELTLGHPVIVGRKTFESYPKLLTGRTNLVITRNPDYRAEGAVTVNSLEAALVEAKKYHDETIFVAGGAEIYRQALPVATHLYLTHIHTVLPDGDAFFPEFSTDDWRIAEKETIPADDRHAYSFDFITWERAR